MLTRNPTPQESCSNWGSYKPCLGGNPGGAALLNRCPSMLIAICPFSEYKFSYLLLKGEKSAIPQFSQEAFFGAQCFQRRGNVGSRSGEFFVLTLYFAL